MAHEQPERIKELLEKEKNGTLNAADFEELKRYRENPQGHG